MNVYICNKDINKGTIISENTYDISDLKSISDFIFKGMTSVSIDELNKSDYNGAKGFSSFIAKTLSSGKNIKNINIDVYFISNTKYYNSVGINIHYYFDSGFYLNTTIMFSFSSCSAYLLLLKGSYRYNKRVCGYDLAKLYNIGEIVVFPESGKHISNDVYEYVNPNTLKEKLTSKSDMNLLLKYTRDFYADGRRVLNYDSTSENKHKICI